jgi:imidazolonepropionase-like amidohydrolase
MHIPINNSGCGAARWLWLTTLTLVLGQTAPAPGQDAAVAFTNATIETTGKAGRIENGTLILRGGKVEAVEKGVKVPDGARVIDAQGKTIMPGILDPFREVTIAGATPDAEPRTIVIGRRRGALPTRSGFAGATFTRVADNFYPYESSYRALLRSGLTGLNLVTNGYGQAAVVRVTPAQPDGMMVNPDGILFTAVTNETNSLDIVRTALETADKVKKGAPVTLPSTPPSTTEPAPAAEPRGRRGRGRPQGRPAGFGGASAPGLSPETLKLWQAVYEGKAPLVANAANAAAIVHLLKAIEPYKDVKLVLTAPGPALYETLDQLAGRPVRVIVHPGLSLKPNTRDRIDLAQLLHEAKVEFAFAQAANSADLLAAQDFPLFSVAYLVRCGLPRHVALEALTARPAALLGLDKTHGTIEPGKAADLLIFTGDPLDPGSQLRQVLIEGRTVYEN